MSTTNWDKALTFITNLTHVEQKYGAEKLNTALTELLKAGGTFAISQGNLYTSDFSTIVLKKLLTDWSAEEETTV